MKRKRTANQVHMDRVYIDGGIDALKQHDFSDEDIKRTLTGIGCNARDVRICLEGARNLTQKALEEKEDPDPIEAVRRKRRVDKYPPGMAKTERRFPRQ
jgi:hypothetical protein